jgi:transcriptional regulator with XRE-family HTH domain
MTELLRANQLTAKNSTASGQDDNPIDVGVRLRIMRAGASLSIRALADKSGLNVNTLSLIENGKTSPSVSTLQQLASALGVPVTEFFVTAQENKTVVHQRSGQRPRAAFAHGVMEDLGCPVSGQSRSSSRSKRMRIAVKIPSCILVENLSIAWRDVLLIQSILRHIC